MITLQIQYVEKNETSHSPETLPENRKRSPHLRHQKTMGSRIGSPDRHVVYAVTHETTGHGSATLQVQNGEERVVEEIRRGLEEIRLSFEEGEPFDYLHRVLLSRRIDELIKRLGRTRKEGAAREVLEQARALRERLLSVRELIGSTTGRS